MNNIPLRACLKHPFRAGPIFFCGFYVFLLIILFLFPIFLYFDTAFFLCYTFEGSEQMFVFSGTEMRMTRGAGSASLSESAAVIAERESR